MTGPVKIDGDCSKWENASNLILTSKENRNVEVALGYVRDDTDVSGEFCMGWDDTYLYVAGHVKDNEIVSNQSGGKIYMDDCVEIFFDTNKDGFYFNGNPHDYQLGIAPSRPGGSPQLWAWGYRNGVPRGVKYAVKNTSDGYDLEIAIPFSEINGFVPQSGKSIRFSISIHDRDKDDKTKKLTWSVDSVSDSDKIIFGTLILKDRNN